MITVLWQMNRIYERMFDTGMLLLSPISAHTSVGLCFSPHTHSVVSAVYSNLLTFTKLGYVTGNLWMCENLKAVDFYVC